MPGELNFQSLYKIRVILYILFVRIVANYSNLGLHLGFILNAKFYFVLTAIFEDHYEMLLNWHLSHL